MGERTAQRPVASGRVPAERALEFGLALSAFSFVLLDSLVNLPTALLALAGNLFYVLVYTRWLKRSTAQNIVIGGAAGAVPPLVGYAGATGHLGWAALVMFAIVFVWTPPHFWALALMIKEHYARAGVPMLPVDARRPRDGAADRSLHGAARRRDARAGRRSGSSACVYGVAALGARRGVRLVRARAAPDDGARRRGAPLPLLAPVPRTALRRDGDRRERSSTRRRRARSRTRTCVWGWALFALFCALFGGTVLVAARLSLARLEPLRAGWLRPDAAPNRGAEPLVGSFAFADGIGSVDPMTAALSLSRTSWRMSPTRSRSRRFRATDLRSRRSPTCRRSRRPTAAPRRRSAARVARPAAEKAVLGEEFGDDGGDCEWIVDPIDGTTNYVRGVPVWATLLALERDGSVELGLVSAPALRRRWWAVRGEGAFADGERCRVSAVSRLEDVRGVDDLGAPDAGRAGGRSCSARGRTAASATSGSTASSRKARSTSRPTARNAGVGLRARCRSSSRRPAAAARRSTAARPHPTAPSSRRTACCTTRRSRCSGARTPESDSSQTGV